jgi:hypothetical protein
MTDITPGAADLAKPPEPPLFPWVAPPKGALAALPLMVLAGDLLLWKVAPGLGLAVLVLLLAGTAALLLKPDFTSRSGKIALALLVLSLIPALEFIQPLSLLILGLGLATFTLWCANAWLAPPFKALGLMLLGPIAATWDLPTSVYKTPLRQGLGARLGRVARVLVVPLGLGAVFVALLAFANPVVQSWFAGGSSFRLPDIDGKRVLFWLICTLVIWPYVAPTSLSHLAQNAPRDLAVTPARLPNALLNVSSVTLSLVLFNLIFAVQNVMDAQYLWFHRALPEGMTYSEYAHRGTNALVATALLAGGFALIVRQLSERPLLRLLLGLWLVQTLIVMVSALMRLDLYMDAYGLTRLRLTALLGMGLIAAGLVLIGWQIWRRKSNSWLLGMIGAVTGGALYGLCFINVSALIASQHLGRSLKSPNLFDERYVCVELGREAHLAILEFEAATKRKVCMLRASEAPHVTDWREWSFRHARMESEIATLRGF